ncbi:TetR family transcriptional regulator [Prauserella shujinwangii]|uniref:TetR family transcriptional regulator n=1 Tax=Prauserella shujinwangii TaxID=1453103 RepID=A0A2T0M1H2_9PSEU|nr:TetR/AcrR family transcriptional regulator [Prauserella shujinwangii]PRX50452.1 TetR family transcriptional regulator [Prauserella shujinwangii]
MTSQNVDERRAQIVRTAAQLFERKGYHNTNVGDIAEAVGLRKPTLYHYVRSKAQILVWIHDDTTGPLLERLEKDVANGIEPREGLRHVVADILELMETKPGYLRVYFEHHREIPEELQAEARKKRDRYLRLVEMLIEDGVDKGMFRPDLDVRLTALSLFGMTNWSYQWYIPGGKLSYHRVADELLGIFFRGVEPR